MVSLQHLLTAASAISMASAACQLSNSYKGGAVDPRLKSNKLCVPQGAGSWTFSLFTYDVEFPTFSGKDPNAGYVGDAQYVIFDNACNVKGIYEPSGNECGIPYFIEENFLADVLTITDEDIGPGGEAFVFDYGNGKFSTGNNHCGCQKILDGLAAGAGCKCAFPVDGRV